jgi:hypothetical protein
MGGGKRKEKRRSVRAASPKSAPKAKTARTGNIRNFFGLLAGKTKKVATIEEINEAAAAGWAGEVKMSADADRAKSSRG